MIPETPEARLKRLKMRSWRRGTKEMDLILGPFADSQLAGLSGTELVRYDALLNENDQDLYLWLSGQKDTPDQHCELVSRIRVSMGGRVA